MRKIALFLAFVLSLGIMLPVAVFAEDETEATQELLGDRPLASLKDLTVPNAGFELDTTGEKPDIENGWEHVGDATVSDEYAHSGDKSIRLCIGEGQMDAEVFTTVSGLEKGATYQFSAWILNPEDNAVDVSYWINYSSKDFYDWTDVTSQLGQKKQHWTVNRSSDWQKIALEFTPPENTASALVEIRLRMTPGLYFADDISLYMVKERHAMDAETDEVFYYSEWETGHCTAVPELLSDPETAKAEFSFVNLDGTETHKETFTNLSEGVNYVFRTEWMTELGKRYHIRMRVYDAAGTVLQEQDFPVFRFNRPTYLGADGVFRKNGKEYTITLGPGVTSNLLGMKPEEGGVTVVQLISPAGEPPFMERMDKAHEQGLLVLVNLYYGSECAGSPSRLAGTIERVNMVKDHPALFGYKIQDEPYQKGQPDEEMITAYETIRNLDPHHPIYFPDSVPGGFPWMFRYCDVLDIDYYGGSNPDAGRIITDVFDLGMKASKGRKPFMLVEQAFNYNGYMPSVDEMRHIAYQAFFSGASGYTLHSLNWDGSDPDTSPMMTRPIWKDICEKWAKWERDFMFGCFVTGEYTFLNYERTKDVMWATFTDGKEIYAICLNREKSTPVTAEIPLVDGANTISVGDFTATRMTGKKETVTGNGTLSLSLEPWEAVVWKVTPETPIDASHIKASSFNDIMYYPWAYNAIATLEEKCIVNRVSDTWFGPGENITRGDYAMFLVRALGLTGSGENFADVDPTAEYAKELAIGKASGVLNGVGDNKFNPEAEITRQDMMTMTSRAMKLQGSADLSAFSDAWNIADYAASHVAAMVAEGLIKGNADGTINPKGNTTRAEAAVIMQRIINK